MLTGRRWGVVLLAMAGAYCIAQWPALARAWWFCDDFARVLDTESPFARACQNGRPLESLWLATLWIDDSPAAWGWNVALRAVQATMHVVVAFLGGAWLARVTRDPRALWAAVPFLLWPLHAEAVLWRTAGSYPLGALLGVTAVWLAWPANGPPRPARLLAAAVCVAASALTNQTPSMLVWLLPGIAWLVGALELRVDRRVVVLAAAHLVAAVVSVVITRLPEFATARAAFPTDPVRKLGLLGPLVGRLWFWRAMYPAPVLLAHGFLLGIVAATIAIARPPLRRALARAAGCVALAALAFAPMLVVGDKHAPPRVMYLGPWLVGAVWLVLWRQTRDAAGAPRPRRVVRALGLLGAVAAVYAFAGREVAREYVALFDADLAVLAQAERLARAHGAHLVAVEPPTPVADHNVLRHRAAVDSALQVRWATPGLLERWSHLTPAPAPVAAAALARHDLETLRGPGFGVVFDHVAQCVLIVQPAPPFAARPGGR